MRRSLRARAAIARWLRTLDGLLDIREGGRTRRVWLVPLSVLVGTVLAFLVIGAITRAPLEVSLPNGAVIAVVMSVLTVTCLSPGGDDAAADDPPGGDDHHPVLGSPGGPWVLVAHLGPAHTDPDAVDAGDRELVTWPPA